MPIDKISDLLVGQEYYVCFIKSASAAKKGKLLAIINETHQYKDIGLTELRIEFGKSTNLVYCKEIGIGRTKMEAKRNYAKFNYEDHPTFSDSFEKVRLK